MLFKVFKTDSVDKYMGCDERKSAYSATENSKNTEKVRVASCVLGVCVLCLFLGTVGCSGVCDRGIFWSYSLSEYYTLQDTVQTARFSRLFCAFITRV